MNKVTSVSAAKLKKKQVQEIKIRKKQGVHVQEDSCKIIFPLNFQENDVMTQYEGIWVEKTAVPKLNAMAERKLKQIYAARNEGNDSEELTENEQIILKRFMKKLKRTEHRQLRYKLIKEKKAEHETEKEDENRSSKPRKKVPGKYLNINYADDPDIVKYSGFYVKKNAVKALDKLKGQ